MAERCHGKASTVGKWLMYKGLKRALKTDSYPTLIKIRKPLGPCPFPTG